MHIKPSGEKYKRLATRQVLQCLGVLRRMGTRMEDAHLMQRACLRLTKLHKSNNSHIIASRSAAFDTDKHGSA